MLVSKVAIDEARYYLSHTAKTMDSLTEKIITGKRITSAADSAYEWLQIRKGYRKYSTLQSINISLNELANDIRIADSAMEAINDIIEQMEGDLTTIVESHPPYEAESKEREALVEIFNTLREQINQLTEPSGNLGARMIMADPQSVPEAGDLTVVIGDNGAFKKIGSLEVHTGPTGLDIPELTSPATDEVIRDALDNLQLAREKLNKRRTVLSLEALSIERSIEYNEETAHIYRMQAEALEIANDTEVSIELKSMELRHSLTIEVIGSLFDNHNQLLALLQ
ncbi:MAG: hypothetical protein ACMUJM_14380 [bacterium]